VYRTRMFVFSVAVLLFSQHAARLRIFRIIGQPNDRPPSQHAIEMLVQKDLGPRFQQRPTQFHERPRFAAAWGHHCTGKLIDAAEEINGGASTCCSYVPSAVRSSPSALTRTGHRLLCPAQFTNRDHPFMSPSFPQLANRGSSSWIAAASVDPRHAVLPVLCQ